MNNNMPPIALSISKPRSKKRSGVGHKQPHQQVKSFGALEKSYARLDRIIGEIVQRKQTVNGAIYVSTRPRKIRGFKDLLA